MGDRGKKLKLTEETQVNRAVESEKSAVVEEIRSGNLTGVVKILDRTNQTENPVLGRKIPEFELEEGVEKLLNLIKNRRIGDDRPIIVQIGGGSDPEKTSVVAFRVKEALGEEATILKMKDYYRGAEYMKMEEAKGKVLDWDQPEALNLDRLRIDLLRLKLGHTIDKPIFSFKTGEKTGMEKFAPKPVIVVEGLLALNDRLAHSADVRAFVDNVKRGHDLHIQSTKRNADLVIKNK